MLTEYNDNELERSLRSLLRGEFSSLTVLFNDHACNYMNAREAIDDGLYDYTDWASDVEKANAADKNSVWTIQWYPDTPVGFQALSASSLPVLLTAVLQSSDRGAR